MAFDRFRSVDDAHRFAAAVQRRRLEALVCNTQAEADAVDYIPAEMDPPVVMVERTTPARERAVERLARDRFGARFVGT